MPPARGIPPSSSAGTLGLDLALLRVPGAPLSPVSWVEPAQRRVGALVLAVSRPGDALRTRLGVLSVVEPGFLTPWGARVDATLEADVSARPGLAGAALADVEGRVLGMYVSGGPRERRVVLPAETLSRVASELLAHGRVRRGYLGVGTQPVRLQGQARAAAGQETGLLVLSVEPGGPSDAAGLALGDVLLALDGTPMERRARPPGAPGARRRRPHAAAEAPPGRQARGAHRLGGSPAVTSLVELSDALQQLVSRVSPAVVGVEQGRGAGTGVVVATDGYLLTNHHVAGSGKGLRIRLPGGDTTKGELVGSDPATDLAVVRVREGSLVQLPLADPASIAVGQLVVAIGNPFRFERSVSLGIVSALDRSLPGPSGSLFEGLLQTDAAINPGNSGGPLVNARGEVVGINTAVIPWAQGMGFAVSARTATWVTSVLMARGSVRAALPRRGCAERAALARARRPPPASPRRCASSRSGRALPRRRPASGRRTFSSACTERRWGTSTTSIGSW